MEADQQMRNLKDFLLVYNRMTEICFHRCTSNFNYRNLTMDEERCVDSCAGKLIRSNHRLMGTYVQLMPRMVQRRVEEMESKAKAAEAAAVASTAASGPEGLPAAQTAVVAPHQSPSDPPAPPLTDAGPVQAPATHGQAPAELVVAPPPGFGEATRPPVRGSGSDAAAATLLPPAVGTADLNPAANGPSYTAVSPQMPGAGGQVQPAFTPSKPVSEQ